MASTLAYQLAVMGVPTDDQLNELRRHVENIIVSFNLQLNVEVGWSERPAHFYPEQSAPATVVFFGGVGATDAGMDAVLAYHSPIQVLPIASASDRVSIEIPERLRHFNCMFQSEGMERIANALLSCVGLLPRKRRVFLSYRRHEATEVAIQLYEELREREFDVFLDTYVVPPARDFQEELWHNLSGSDLLIMLDTTSYFASRWTATEFGRALNKGISVLRIGWPGVAPSSRVNTSNQIELSASDFVLPDFSKSPVTPTVAADIAQKVEACHSQAYAVRYLNMVNLIKLSVEGQFGEVIGIGQYKSIVIKLPSGEVVTIYPIVGIPTSMTFYEALHKRRNDVAIVYDHLGMHPDYIEHMNWLAHTLGGVPCIKLREFDFDLTTLRGNG